MQTLQFPSGLEEAFKQNIEDHLPAVPLEQEAPKIVVEESPQIDNLRERILEGLKVATAYADRLADPDYAKAVRDKLSRSNVRGSRVEGVKNLNDVTQLLSSVNNWRVVAANLKDKQVECIQGELPQEYSSRAYSAYATVREIMAKFGQPGLGSIQAKQGYQKPDEFYFCTMLRYPTNIITVQLKKETNGAEYEYVHQWFAGPEVSSMLRLDDGDSVVRCSSQIPLLSEYANTQHRNQGSRWGGAR